MFNIFFEKRILACIILFLFLTNISIVSSVQITMKNHSNTMLSSPQMNTREVFNVTTKDGTAIFLTRFVGYKQPSIILIHGMGCDHKIFDWDENHSLARFLNHDGWDVWLLDLRTHDGDGDFFCAKESDREYINRYWDFDNTLLNIDVVAAVDFVKNKTGYPKIVLAGHSYGGYLAYAYAQKLGEENLSGIITTGAAPYGNPPKCSPRLCEMYTYGFYLGNTAFVNPLGHPYTFKSKMRMKLSQILWKPSNDSNVFYLTTTPQYIQKRLLMCFDSEPAGVWVDMYFGKDKRKYGNRWVDPQTLYDYSKNLTKITVPILFIAGQKDPQDPSSEIYHAYENVSSTIKEFHSIQNHSHLDLLLGDDASSLIFSVITNWMNTIGT